MTLEAYAIVGASIGLLMGGLAIKYKVVWVAWISISIGVFIVALTSSLYMVFGSSDQPNPEPSSNPVPGIAPAGIPAHPLVCVKDAFHGMIASDLSHAVSFVNKYTNSHVVRTASARGCTRTITVSYGKVPNATPGGVTVGYNSGDKIVIKSGISQRYLTRLMEHELGHAFGLDHNDGCNIMRPIIVCGFFQNPVPERFLSSDIRILGQN